MKEMVISMKKLIIGSNQKSAGKTSVILGITKALKKRICYMKPFGDRLVYRKKQLWDYDSVLLTTVLGLDEKPEDMSLGFEHAKLRYMYDAPNLKKKLLEKVSHMGKEKDLLFIECGEDLACGISVHLDPIAVTNYMDGKLIIVLRGNADKIIDDIIFLKKVIDVSNINFSGVILNQIQDVDELKQTYLSEIDKLGINVLGIIPYKEELTHVSVEYLSEYLFAKIIAGEDRLNNVVKNIFVGAMSASSALRNPLFKKENKLIITSGDRSDMILAAIESDTAGVILTNNVLPPRNIISKAHDHDIPLLLVASDTFQIAKLIDDMEPLITQYDSKKIELLDRLMKKYVDIKAIANI